MAEAGYIILDHTADVGVKAWGATPAEAFSMAARGMFEVVLDTDPQAWRPNGRQSQLPVDVEGAAWQSLLVNWLAELVYLFDVESFVPLDIRFEQCEPPRCHAILSGIVMADPGDTDGTA